MFNIYTHIYVPINIQQVNNKTLITKKVNNKNLVPQLWVDFIKLNVIKVYTLIILLTKQLRNEMKRSKRSR